MIKPHGGKLINRFLSKKKAEILRKSDLPRIKCNIDTILDIEKISTGAYSPLIGFMDKDNLSDVVEKMRLSDGTPWTIPIFLTVNDKTAKQFSKGEEIIITDEKNYDIALLKINGIYSFHKEKWAKNVYGTDSRKHPGVKRLFDMHGRLLGGDIWMINKPSFGFEKINLFPEETRKMIKKKNWKTIAGFQTRNAPHRAHEYLQKLALSITDGILIHPIIGWKKDGDFRPEIVIKAYQTLIKKYYPKDSAIFAGLAIAMRYAGPREAVFHAIIRKNYGCTHFIVGRDHAGVGDFYNKYDAHKIFDEFPKIGIIPLLMKGPYFCKKCNEIVSDKICPHSEKWHKHISGTMVREALLKNKPLPEYIMRKEVFTALKKAGENGFI